VLDRVKIFSDDVRADKVIGLSGKPLKNTIVVGIGGSYLSIEFVHEALRSLPICKEKAEGRKLRFLANVDPIDFSRVVEGISVEETLVVINSKTFTTAETILNARTIKNWLIEGYQKLGRDLNTPEQ